MTHTSVCHGWLYFADMWWTGQSTRRAGRVNGRGNCHRKSGGENRRCAWTTKMRMEPTNNVTLARSSDGIQMDQPKRRQQFYRECGENTWAGLSDGIQMDLPKRRWQFYRECGENTWAPHRGRLCRPLVAAVPPPLFISFIRGASLVGGNCGIQKCDSIDPLSLVIKCLGGGMSWGTW
jgi:hypothetical protein